MDLRRGLRGIRRSVDDINRDLINRDLQVISVRLIAVTESFKLGICIAFCNSFGRIAMQIQLKQLR